MIFLWWLKGGVNESASVKVIAIKYGRIKSEFVGTITRYTTHVL